MTDHLQGILGTLPDKPSCYLRKDSGNRIILVGRAVNLRARVRSYFYATAHDHPKTLKPVCKNRCYPTYLCRLRANRLSIVFPVNIGRISQSPYYQYINR